MAVASDVDALKPGSCNVHCNDNLAAHFDATAALGGGSPGPPNSARSKKALDGNRNVTVIGGKAGAVGHASKAQEREPAQERPMETTAKNSSRLNAHGIVVAKLHHPRCEAEGAHGAGLTLLDRGHAASLPVPPTTAREGRIGGVV